MRCLYCGKELALLKRWTGGGEFCSDAHRLRYQEEYNQLALNRLLQAKPPVPPNEAPPAEPAQTKPAPVVEAPAAAYVAPRVSEPAYEAPSPVAVQEAPAVIVAEAEPELPEEPAPAAAAGFVVELPTVALAEVAPMSRPDLEFLDAVSAALPNRVFEPLNLGRDTFGLETAGLVTYEPHNRITNNVAIGARERKLEVREFMRTDPIVEIELSPAGEAGLETTSEAMDILILPQPPPALPVLWQEPPVGFSECGTELGDLARLAFSTIGFSGEEQSVDRENTSAIAVEPVIEEQPENPAAAIVADVLSDLVPEVKVEAAPVPEPQPEPEAAPVAAVQPEAASEPEPAMALPELSTKPLPLTLHLVAPGKGKPVQVFSSAANAVEAQVPRSTSLPLRALMTFGPAPAPVRKEVKNDVKPEPKKPAAAPVRPDPRLVNAKPQAAKPEVAAALKPAVKVDAKQEKKPEAKEPVKPVKEDAKPTPAFPAPLAAPFPGSNDLGLPRLNLESSRGFLGQIPILAKVAIMLVLLAGLGGFIVFSSRSGGAATTGNGGTIVAGSALPAGETGWITNWGADPGVRRTRQISILRSSQTLTDYRIEMNGQIESKAIGWVFRAADPKNFYVTKLEIVKPGLEPTVALVRFAIINGEEQAHAQLPLPMKVRLDTMYKIRFDAVGNHFTTYVQDQKIDDWTDDHVKTGGVGFYRESGEDATLKGGMNVVPLIVKK